MYGLLTLLPTNKVYITRYNIYKIERLGHQYDTNCLNYDRESEFATRHDCIKSYFITEIEPICNRSTLVGYGFLMRSAPNDTIIESCTISNRMYMHTNEKCTQSCRMNCHESYYSQRFDVESTVNGTLMLMTKDWKLPDLTIKYIPEMNFMAFVCNFGGLLGMWLGLSFVNILSTIYDWMSNMIKPKLNIHLHQNFDNNFDLRINRTRMLFINR